MENSFSPARLEAFSDGVIAVIITIMVLELKVPAENGVAGLRVVVPNLLVYALSFTFVGLYWVNHHHLLGRLEHSNNRILWANLGWLFTASLVPYFTSYVVDKHDDGFSVSIYSACMLASGVTFLVLRYAVDCEVELHGRLTQVDRATQTKHWVSLLVYGVAIVLAHWMPHVALLCTAGVTLFWIVPTLGLFGKEAAEYRHAAREQDDATHKAGSR
jgi:uncharacterized membrane protein